jgi:hypothetical protein
VITAASLYYQPGPDVPAWARCYTPEWVDKLYRGVARHYSRPFRFVCLTDGSYQFAEPVETQPLRPAPWSSASLQLHAIEADRLVIMGLDTVITGPLDDIFAYAGDLAVPRDPYRPGHPCNGVMLCPTRKDIAAVDGGATDMTALEKFPFDWLDDLYPGQIVSYKAHVRSQGLGDARIVYFHGFPKMSDLPETDPVRGEWER